MSDSCPSETALEQLAADTGDHHPIHQHVVECAACRQTLETIHDNNAFLARNRAALKRLSATTSWETPTIPGYRIEREIHRGGQGVVFLAVQESTRQRVALKVLRHGRFATPADRARFEREIHILAQLDHPNIVTIHDSGVSADCFYLVMKYLDGHPLDQIPQFGLPGPPVATTTPLGNRGVFARPARTSPKARIEKLLRLFLKVCDAVGAAHMHGVIHRDLKPANILVDDAGNPHVLDFGLAKLIDVVPATAEVTRTGLFMGSLPWASPEQTEGHSDRVDTRSDVYSLGVILYELLTGRFPYAVAGPMRVALDNIAHATPPRPSSVRRELNGEVDTIVLKALEKDKERRYQSVESLKSDIQRYLAGQPLEAKRDSTWYVLRNTARRHKLPLLIAASFLTLVVGFALERSRYARRLEQALHAAGIERGRLEGRQGNTLLAEQLLWREHLVAAPDPQTSQSFWALWELYTAQPCLASWQAHTQTARVDFSPSGDCLVSSTADQLRAWSVEAAGPGQLLYELPVEGTAPPVTAISPSGSRLAIADAAGRFGIFDLETGTECTTWLTKERPPLALVFHDEHRLISLDHDGNTLRRWRIADGVPSAALEPPTPASSIALTPRRDLLAVVRPGDREIDLLIPDNFELRTTIDAGPLMDRALSPKSLNAASFSADGKLVAAVCYDFVGVWNAITGAQVQLLQHDWAVNSIVFCDDHHLVTAGKPGILVWELPAGRIAHRYAGNLRGASSLSYGSRGNLAACDVGGAIRLWEPAPFLGRNLLDLVPLHNVAYSPDGRLLAYCGEPDASGANVWIRATQTGEVLHTLHGPAPIMASVSFSPDAQYLAASSYNHPGIRIWNLSDGSSRDLLTRHTGIASVAFCPDGGAILAGDNVDGIVSAWDWRAGLQRWQAADPDSRIPSVTFSPDTTWCVAAEYRGSIHVFDAATGHHRYVIPAHTGPARTVDISSDGRTIASSGDDGIVRLWDAANGQPRGSLIGHPGTVYALAFLPDDRLLVSAGHDGFIRLWDTQTRQLLAALPGDDSVISSLAIDTDGRTLAFGTFGGRLGRWDLHYYDRHIAGNLALKLKQLETETGRIPDAHRSWVQTVLP